GNGGGIPILLNAAPAAGADRRDRIVVNLATGDIGQLLVQQRRKRAKNTTFGLTSKAQQNEVVARENRVHELRDDRLVVPDDARKQRFAGLQLADEVVANFVLHRSPRKRLRRRVA